jgi:hypothetical protein
MGQKWYESKAYDLGLGRLGFIFSVAKGPKFRPQNSKGAPQKCVWPEKLAAEFSFNMPKKGRKGAELFEADYSYKNLKISAEKYASSPNIFDFSVPLPKEIVCKRQ